MPKPSTWKPVGTVVGNTSTSEFTFILKSYESRVGDIVAVKMDIPGSGAGERTITVRVWGRIISIDRYNPFFPFEAAQELGEQGLAITDTVLSTTRDQLQATVLVLGYTHEDTSNYALYSVTYPIQPAAQVLYPPTEAISILLQGKVNNVARLKIGNLISRRDVDISLQANPVVARHMAILAMTGGGKTVAARRIIRELVEKGFPLLILDPHGDYLGLWKKRDLFPGSEINLYFPHVKMTERNSFVLHTLISKMTSGLTDPQRELLDAAMERTDVDEDEGLVDYLERLRAEVNGISDSRLERSKGPLRRALEFVRQKIVAMEAGNARLRASLKDYEFKELPDPYDNPTAIIAPKQVSILYLGGYDHLTQSTIVSIVMDSLFAHRASMTNRIPPFLAVVEEAHNFIPSGTEGQSETPSLDSIRRVITEGRKFGTGLLLISQRPSRLDQTILSQCNSFLILRLVNPRDQQFVRQVMENLSEADARMLPGFGPGEGIISGQAVRFPLMVNIHMDQELLVDAIGNENFIEQASEWSRTEAGMKATAAARSAQKLKDANKRSQRSRKRK